jgi:hypothetical protein
MWYAAPAQTRTVHSVSESASGLSTIWVATVMHGIRALSDRVTAAAEMRLMPDAIWSAIFTPTL